MIVLSY